MKAYDLERNNTFIIASSNERLEIMDYLIDHDNEEVIKFKSMLSRHRKANSFAQGGVPRLRACHSQDFGEDISKGYISRCIRRHSAASRSEKLPHSLSPNHAIEQTSFRKSKQVFACSEQKRRVSVFARARHYHPLYHAQLKDP